MQFVVEYFFSKSWEWITLSVYVAAYSFYLPLICGCITLSAFMGITFYDHPITCWCIALPDCKRTSTVCDWICISLCCNKPFITRQRNAAAHHQFANGNNPSTTRQSAIQHKLWTVLVLAYHYFTYNLIFATTLLLCSCSTFLSIISWGRLPWTPKLKSHLPRTQGYKRFSLLKLGVG